MTTFDWIYVLMAAIQLRAWGYVIRKAFELDWDRPSRWIALRMSLVSAGVLVLTLMGWLLTADSDIVLKYAFIIGLVSMTVLLQLYLPDIVAGMTDPDVAEDLNIRVNGTEEEHKEITHQ